MTGAVTIASSSIAKAWKQMGGDDTWLQLRTRSGSVQSFGAAVDEANEAAAGRGEGDNAFGAFPASTPKGFAVQLIRAGTLPVVRRWANDLGAGLAERGFDGILGGAPDVWAPCLNAALEPTPTGYVAWTLDATALLDDKEQEVGWLVGESATARIGVLADRWARRPGAQVHLRQNLYTMAVDLDDTAPQLVRSVSESGMAGLDFILDLKAEATHVSLSFGGEGIFQLIGGEQSWQERIGVITQALVALPADTNQGFIRTGRRNCIAFQNVEGSYPLPGINEADIRYNKHLLDSYLPDAHGVQVVRTAHLERAHDLSGWDLTDLGSGRHLLRASDLASWYADVVPDPDVLARARRDFAGALLTKQVIADNSPHAGP